MQGRPRNPNSYDGRGYSSNYRNYSRGGGSFGRKPYLPPPPPPPPRGKEEILMEAGRLAAEYLVYKGLLPPDSLPQPPKWLNGKYQEFKGFEKEGFGRNRRYDDEYSDRMGPRNQFRGRRQNGRWMSRSRGYGDMEEEYEFGPGYYRRDRRSGFDQFMPRSEYMGESELDNYEVVEDTGSKASSSSTRRDGMGEVVDGGLSRPVVDDGKVVISSEAGDHEVKSDGSGDSKMKTVEEGLDVQNCVTEGERENGDDLVNGSKMEQEATGEASQVVEGSSGEPQVNSEEDIAVDTTNSSPTNQIDSKSQTPENMSVPAGLPAVELFDQQQEGCQSPLGSGSLKPPINDEEEETDEREGMKRKWEYSMEDELSQPPNARAKQSSPEVDEPRLDAEKVGQETAVEELPMDEEMVANVAVDQEKPLSADALIPKVEAELNDKMEEDKELLPASFKICDLNSMHGHDVTQISDDPDPELVHPSPRLGTGTPLSMDFGLSVGNSSNGADDFNRLSENDRVVQVINLEDNPTIDTRAGDPSKPIGEPIYPNLDSFLNQPEHADPPCIQDGYSLAISEFLGSDISHCSSDPTDLNNLHTGMGLHDVEGVPNDDDSIFVSLDEIPIGFMEVWDQPPQEYGKYF